MWVGNLVMSLLTIQIKFWNQENVFKLFENFSHGFSLLDISQNNAAVQNQNKK